MSSFFQKAVQGRCLYTFSPVKNVPGNTARVAKKHMLSRMQNASERLSHGSPLDLSYVHVSHLYPVHTDGTIFRSAAYFLKRHVQSF